MATTKPFDFVTKDYRLAKWLCSNPTLDAFRIETPVILVRYDDEVIRWPVVPDDYRDKWLRV